jgi:hypothetical protein
MAAWPPWHSNQEWQTNGSKARQDREACSHLMPLNLFFDFSRKLAGVVKRMSMQKGFSPKKNNRSLAIIDTAIGVVSDWAVAIVMVATGVVAVGKRQNGGMPVDIYCSRNLQITTQQRCCPYRRAALISTLRVQILPNSRGSHVWSTG